MDIAEAPAESRALDEFARVLEQQTSLLPRLETRREGADAASVRVAGQPGGLNLRQDDTKNGLGRLVLTLIKLLHELLEKQAILRMEGGALTEAEVERLGTTLMRQAEEIDRLRRAFKLEREDLNIDLGPLGKLL